MALAPGGREGRQSWHLHLGGGRVEGRSGGGGQQPGGRMEDGGDEGGGHKPLIFLARVEGVELLGGAINGAIRNILILSPPLATRAPPLGSCMCALAKLVRIHAPPPPGPRNAHT